MKPVLKLVPIAAILLLLAINVKSQQRIYFAKVTSNNRIEKGLLFLVTKDSLVIQNNNNQLVSFKPEDIKVVAIKVFKKRGLQNFFKDVNVEDDRYEKIPNSDIKVLKPGQTEPTLAEEISTRVGVAIFSLAGNAILNTVALTVYDDKIAKFRLNCSKQEYDKQIDQLKFHSYTYIIKPDTKAELAKIKAISESNKINRR
ncbi:hypothetical protein EZ428_17230 [Pedobacter frigiditerrae]|uniref:Uncharacterized protein n=1 Tax=Pedobacter frigiditerrae TaxID=2530452 RepID=A0A4R0MRB0_9SPHI|nr:hypothetical protein [Pedobacter frigiditerrae]TCC89435.1 hypothetical protein EZ428_17230 [Pedobacter frigiditerrae]